jgi:hypothetical protein
MLSNINFQDEVGDLFNQKLKWIKVMPTTRKRLINKIDIHNPDEEEKSNEIIKLFPNIKFVKTNKIPNRLITNYITNYDLIIINDFSKEFTRDFFINKVKYLSETGKIWIFTDGLDILNTIISEIDTKLKINLRNFSSKNMLVEEILDELSVKYFKTSVDYMYNIHNELLDFIFENNYLPLEKKIIIKNYLLDNYTDYTKLSFNVYIIG